MSSALQRLDQLNRSLWWRALMAIALFGLTMICYQHLNRTLEPKLDLMTDLDRAIPFWPWTILVYHSHGLILLAAALVIRAQDYTRLLLAMLVVNFLCYGGFILFTAHFPRPDVSMMAPPWGPILRHTYSTDPPGNTFPSIHVATTALLVARMRLQRGGWLWPLWGALICISTMTVKQHFIVDVIGGLALAILTYKLTYRNLTPHQPADAAP